MTKEELVAKLKELSNNLDIEDSHIKADELLLEYIDDIDIINAYHKLERWYA